MLVLLASRSLILGLRLYFCVGRLAFNSEGGSDSLQVRERRVIFRCISEALSNSVEEIVGSSLVTMFVHESLILPSQVFQVLRTILARKKRVRSILLSHVLRRAVASGG